MVASPTSLVLDDLANPRFSPEAAAVLHQMASRAADCPLIPSALLHAASAQTGLTDFGDDAFRERLEVLCRAVREEGNLSPVGVTGVFGQLVTNLRNRLLLQDLLKRHPEIHDEPIERPIIICGLPRTGTTHLLNLLAADPRLRYLSHWESAEPVTDDADGVRTRYTQQLAMIKLLMPHFERMHEMGVDDANEEIELMKLDFSTMLFETMGVLPTWRDYYVSHDQARSYGYLRTALKAVQWQRGDRRRWVLKSPQHLEQLPLLYRVFPDATYVLTHRDPVAVTASMATMAAYSARMTQATPDPVAIGRYWAGAVERLLRACLRDHDKLPPEQTIDVLFQEFMANEMATVQRVYALAGLPLDTAARASIEQYLAEHRRGRHGAVVYDPDSLDIDRAERHEALRPYIERFGVAVEAA
jgi:hypothetical protein